MQISNCDILSSQLPEVIHIYAEWRSICVEVDVRVDQALSCSDEVKACEAVDGYQYDDLQAQSFGSGNFEMAWSLPRHRLTYERLHRLM